MVFSARATLGLNLENSQRLTNHFDEADLVSGGGAIVDEHLEIEALLHPDRVEQPKGLQREHVLAQIVAVLEDELERALVEIGVGRTVEPGQVERSFGRGENARVRDIEEAELV